jgi:hypothetical protein
LSAITIDIKPDPITNHSIATIRSERDFPKGHGLMVILRALVFTAIEQEQAKDDCHRCKYDSLAHGSPHYVV